MSERHPATASWELPPSDRAALPAPLSRTNLRALAARPGRFEHHLVVVGRVGDLQLELPTASEPLYFAHVNVSDEYVVALPTGDPLLDGFPFRVFVSDAARAENLVRLRHQAGDLVLHPYGYRHWTEPLRPPFAVPEIPPGMRRCGVSLVMCASQPAPPAERPLFVSAGLEEAVKRYDLPGAAEAPVLLARLGDERSRPLGAVGNAAFRLEVEPARVAPRRGAYVVVLEATGAGHFPADLIHVPPGAELSGAGLGRAIVVSSDEADAAPPPESWSRVPEAPFAPFEDSPRGSLPWSHGALTVREDADDPDAFVRVEVDGAGGPVPRYWLARMLFRLALHGFRLARLETYGGFAYDDTPGVVAEGDVHLGMRDAGFVAIPRSEARGVVEQLYRAVAPAGYVERLS